MLSEHLSERSPGQHGRARDELVIREPATHRAVKVHDLVTKT